MTANVGTVVLAPIVPNDSADTYGTHYATYGIGGYRTVNTVADLNSITTTRREEGMLVYSKDTELVYQLGPDLATWTQFQPGGGGGGGAPINSPHFTGIPTAPTASAGTNTTQLATTAFVTGALVTENANLASTTEGRGVDMIGNSVKRLPNVAAIQALTTATTVNKVMIDGFSVAGDGGAGEFTYVPADTTSTDDGATILVDTHNRRWYRSYTSILSPQMFGATRSSFNLSDGVTTTGSGVVSSPSNGFLNAAPGMIIYVFGPNSGGGARVNPGPFSGFAGSYYPLSDTIASVAAGGASITLTSQLSTQTLTGCTVMFGIDDTTALNFAISSVENNLGELALPPGDLFIGSAPSNSVGVRFKGAGRILQKTNEGPLEILPTTDEERTVFGQEYAIACLNAIIARSNINIVLSGDSTVQGTGITNNSYLLNNLITNIAYQKGVHHLQSVVNNGHSGKTSADWIGNGNNYLAADLALNPLVYYVQWGINDPDFNPSIAAFISNMETGLARCRVTFTVDQMTIVLAVPNPTFDIPNYRDARWYYQIRKGLRYLARKYQCVLVDTWAALNDSNIPSGYTNDYGDDRRIHPKNGINSLRAQLICDAIFPDAVFSAVGIGDATTQNISGSFYPVLSTALPATYPFGYSIYRAAPGSAWIYNGAVFTVNHADNIQMQWNYPFTGFTKSYAYRIGQSNAWGAWVITQEEQSAQSVLFGSTTAGTNTYSIGTNVSGYSISGGVCTVLYNVTLTAVDGTMAGTIGIKPSSGAFPTSAEAANPVFNRVGAHSNVTFPTNYTDMVASVVSGNTIGLQVIGPGQPRILLTAAMLANTSEIFGQISYRV